MSYVAHNNKNIKHGYVLKALAMNPLDIQLQNEAYYVPNT